MPPPPGGRVKVGRTQETSSMSRAVRGVVKVWWVKWEGGGRGRVAVRRVVIVVRRVREEDSRAEREVVRDGGEVWAWRAVRDWMCARAWGGVVEGSQRRRTWWRWGLEGRSDWGLVLRKVVERPAWSGGVEWRRKDLRPLPVWTWARKADWHRVYSRWQTLGEFLDEVETEVVVPR